ncbi:hypothetical protein ABD91_03175 [Lysinibacillus sphaericus]|uniref:hypothetical protein n=1 Tax=Lysinibacillus sphaericus TaxID=1421 RepID=UPI0018CDC310|nr:hypothetical protein [Lysinibacillus sphaericus]MBG9689921.1 hypothetical protein [Lysinibacillus sphaericus]
MNMKNLVALLAVILISSFTLKVQADSQVSLDSPEWSYTSENKGILSDFKKLGEYIYIQYRSDDTSYEILNDKTGKRTGEIQSQRNTYFALDNKGNIYIISNDGRSRKLFLNIYNTHGKKIGTYNFNETVDLYSITATKDGKVLVYIRNNVAKNIVYKFSDSGKILKKMETWDFVNGYYGKLYAYKKIDSNSGKILFYDDNLVNSNSYTTKYVERGIHLGSNADGVMYFGKYEYNKPTFTISAVKEDGKLLWKQDFKGQSTADSFQKFAYLNNNLIGTMNFVLAVDDTIYVFNNKGLIGKRQFSYNADYPMKTMTIKYGYDNTIMVEADTSLTIVNGNNLKTIKEINIPKYRYDDYYYDGNGIIYATYDDAVIKKFDYKK